MDPYTENDYIFEQYVRNQLVAEQRQAFEAHFLDCDECFEKLQTAERFIAGVRHAAAHGLLDDEAPALTAKGPRVWWKWGFVAASCATVALTVVVVWIYVLQMPKLRGEIDQVAAVLQAERRNRAGLEQRTMQEDQAEANIPLVILQSTRAVEAEPASVLLQPKARHLVLWMEMGPTRSRDFRLEIFTRDDRLITSLDHVERGPYGALSASLPADTFPAGDYLVRITSQDSKPPSIAGEYRLRVRRP